VPPLNDEFDDAEVITGSSGEVTGTNVDATLRVDLGEDLRLGMFSTAPFPAMPTFGGGATVWYQWTAPSSRPYFFWTSNTSDGYSGDINDTMLFVGTGASLGAFTLVGGRDVGWNDDASSIFEPDRNFFSGVKFDAVEGTTYRIAVDGYNGLGTDDVDYNAADTAQGAFKLHWEEGPPPPPDNDVFPNSITRRDDPYALGENGGGCITATTFGATADSGEPEHRVGTPAARSVWHVWSAWNDGTYRFWIESGDPGMADPILAAYNQPNSIDGLINYARGDGTMDVVVDMNAQPFGNYYIAVDTTSGGGEYTLRWKRVGGVAPTNDDWADAEPISGSAGGSVVGSVPLGATAECDEPPMFTDDFFDSRADDFGPFGSVWYRLDATESRMMAFEITNASGGSHAFGSSWTLLVVQVFKGSSLATLTQVPGPDPTDSFNYQEFFNPALNGDAYVFQAVAGETYYVRVMGEYDSTHDSFTLTWRSATLVRPNNDDFANAAELPNGDNTVIVTSDGATLEPGETGGFGELLSLWYHVNLPNGGQVHVNLTNSTQPNGAIGYVYRGTSLVGLVEIGRLFVDTGFNRGAVWWADPGIDYYVRIAAADFDQPFTLRTQVYPAVTLRPETDDFTLVGGATWDGEQLIVESGSNQYMRFELPGGVLAHGLRISARVTVLDGDFVFNLVDGAEVGDPLGLMRAQSASGLFPLGCYLFGGRSGNNEIGVSRPGSPAYFAVRSLGGVERDRNSTSLHLELETPYAYNLDIGDVADRFLLVDGDMRVEAPRPGQDGTGIVAVDVGNGASFGTNQVPGWRLAFSEIKVSTDPREGPAKLYEDDPGVEHFVSWRDGEDIHTFATEGDGLFPSSPRIVFNNYNLWSTLNWPFPVNIPLTVAALEALKPPVVDVAPGDHDGPVIQVKPQLPSTYPIGVEVKMPTVQDKPSYGFWFSFTQWPDKECFLTWLDHAVTLLGPDPFEGMAPMGLPACGLTVDEGGFMRAYPGLFDGTTGGKSGYGVCQLDLDVWYWCEVQHDRTEKRQSKLAMRVALSDRTFGPFVDTLPPSANPDENSILFLPNLNVLPPTFRHVGWAAIGLLGNRTGLATAGELYVGEVVVGRHNDAFPFGPLKALPVELADTGEHAIPNYPVPGQWIDPADPLDRPTDRLLYGGNDTGVDVTNMSMDSVGSDPSGPPGLEGAATGFISSAGGNRGWGSAHNIVYPHSASLWYEFWVKGTPGVAIDTQLGGSGIGNFLGYPEVVTNGTWQKISGWFWTNFAETANESGYFITQSAQGPGGPFTLAFKQFHATVSTHMAPYYLTSFDGGATFTVVERGEHASVTALNDDSDDTRVYLDHWGALDLLSSGLVTLDLVVLPDPIDPIPSAFRESWIEYVPGSIDTLPESVKVSVKCGGYNGDADGQEQATGVSRANLSFAGQSRALMSADGAISQWVHSHAATAVPSNVPWSVAAFNEMRLRFGYAQEYFEDNPGLGNYATAYGGLLYRAYLQTLVRTTNPVVLNCGAPIHLHMRWQTAQ